jgi:CTP:molybdopterin cytidylyltransferase MocA
MGRSKPLVRRAGQSFLARAIRGLWTSCDTVVVVLGHAGARVRREAEAEFTTLAQQGRLQPDLRAMHNRRPASHELEVHFIHNPQWSRGMLGSARLGITAALVLDPAAILLAPVDHPAVSAATVQALAGAIGQAVDAYRPPRGGGRARTARRSAPGFAYAVVPRYRGERGHPVALSTPLAQAVARDRRAHDLSDAIRRNARLVGYLDVSDRGVVANVNRPAGAPARGR